MSATGADREATLARTWAGLDRSRPVVHVGYDKVEELLAALEPQLPLDRIDAVAGVARSGIVPATILSQRLGRELFLLRCQRHNGAVQWLGEAPPPGTRLLVVDDIVSSGLTLSRIRDFLAPQNLPALTLALFVDGERSTVQPDFAHPAPGFVRFAWDRRETVPEARRLREQVDMAPPEREVDCFGVDMDGVLLPDLRKAHYQRDLPLALRLRHDLAPYPAERLPQIDWSRAHIITGRPAMDYAPTRAWLDAHGFAGCPLHCRDPGQHDHSAEGVVGHKVAALTRLGASVFLESELIQATLIARACPTVDVVWWGRRQRLRLGAVAPVRWG
ncbi:MULTISPECIES: phosphoribosyltransferase family protein [Ramlibacter]|uniref:Phosphoribosyltransferase domain-containing protein n=1 Tax=Ramlibacter aquaticus TaxID=2780094 RepID=A0ABR9SCF4_9BURK|nr:MULTISPECIES: phosphoribosyltransferase family protein [Ramlibacter]MBE7940029.1 hypothetical protein [Ramlibacter aquaticus]